MMAFLHYMFSSVQLIAEQEFEHLEKIKTIGSSYMVASGLGEGCPFNSTYHLQQLADFALRLNDILEDFGESSKNQFTLRIGINNGPIVAGVIAVCKPHYDIWGTTVNVASRMESTSVPGRIQMTMKTYHRLRHRPYEFEYRGMAPVKGIDGLLETYFLERGKCATPATPGVQRPYLRRRSSSIATLVLQLLNSQKKFSVNSR
ncbi:hypothetical protein NP493_1902g00019 [Ridgeia piscesae]|uniref:adenylate cyclase n=1 Tax=Ridgeia piscesae TaxID=27915 RepID=A0AAD9JQM8_RIDPI|nr:hypothetical protein NP493_1902g00019 [Ridgeia piscesae]